MKHRNQQGLSLVELLIAMVLGLFLTAGALEMMLASRSLHRTTDDSSRIQESGRFALAFLSKDIRMGGYNSNEDPVAEGKVFWDGACDASDPCTFDSGDTTPDQIALILDPSNDQDCTGNSTNLSETTVIANVYSVADLDGDGVSSLYCQGFNMGLNEWVGGAGTPPQPLVDGVENMQVLYGISDPVNNNQIQRYVSADQVPNWGDIAAVNLSLLINNGQPNGNGDLRQRRFTLLDSPQLTFNDRHARQAFGTTIAVNNIVYQDPTANQ